MHHTLQDYVTTMKSVLDALPMAAIERTVDELYDAWAKRRQVFIMGNGGSASTASHFVCDLAKNTRVPGVHPVRVSAFSDNLALFSAFANDEGYDNVFAGPLAAQLMPDDVVIGISTSGNSVNVLKAIELANQMGAFTIGFTGFDGGKLGTVAGLHVHVTCDCIEQVEDIHLMLEHMICMAVRRRIEKQAAVLRLIAEFPYGAD
jgi:D-sedoheptulose 7-phosphate isomerase